MQGQQYRPEHLATSEQMVQIAPRELAACRTDTSINQRRRINGVPRIFDIDMAGSAVPTPRAARTSGQNAVKHVNPARDRLDDVIRGANAHEVVG